MGWLLAVFVLALGIFVVYRLRGATVYLSNPMGYTAINFGTSEEDKLRPVSRERYERLLARFAKGDLFDELWVSHVHDRYGGVVLSNEGEETELSLSFRSLKEPDRIDAFRERMAACGYRPTEEHPYNVGMGEAMESLRLEYVLPTDLDEVRRATDLALTALQGEAGESIFVYPWRSQDGPGRFWITVRPPRDVLSEVP